jgi:murein DD-endopeptidase MepM/ murein hydrolase activator NlpD
MANEIVSPYGIRRHPILMIAKLHTGVDYEAALGEGVRAAAAGRIAPVTENGGYGNAVMIDHGGGMQTLYAHLSRVDVKDGDCVAKGDIIGGAGSTGLTTGVRLHFEVRQDGNPIDPLVVMNGPGPNPP